MPSPDPRWFFALNLGERAALLAGDSSQFSEDISFQTERKLRRWLNTPAFEVRSNLTHFLRCHDLEETQFLRILEGSPDRLKIQAPNPPDWLTTFDEAFNQRDVIDNDSTSPIDSSGFLHLVYPLINDCREKITRLVRNLNSEFPNTIDEQPAVCALLEGLLEQLLEIIARPLVLEVNIARISKKLKGSSPSDRFSSFQQLLTLPSYRNEIFTHYPGLARHCVRICEQWFAGVKEFLYRACSDHNAIMSTFNGAKIGSLIHAEIMGSDPHHNGRRIVIASYASGMQIAYKPRPVAIAKCFQSFIEWINAHGQTPHLRTLAIIDRIDYGWIEYVEADSCSSALEVEHFYRRQGALLAILHCLGGIDCHFENVVAAGANPVLIDIETLFQPRQTISDIPKEPDLKARRQLADSVLATGLLPTPTLVGNSIVDLSALGAKPNQTTHLETIGLENQGTDYVRVASIPFRVEETRNRPKLDGEAENVVNHVLDLEAGFSLAYEILRTNRSELLSAAGPLAEFGESSIRVLLRPTAMYSRLIQESFHPNALIDELERERVLGQLWWATSSQPALLRAVFSEYVQALNGDTPYFSSAPNSCDLISSNGEVIDSMFSQSGLSVAQERIGRLSDSDLQIQKWLIRASVFSLSEVNATTGGSERDLNFRETPLEYSLAVGERLESLAVRTTIGDSWLSLTGRSNSTTSRHRHFTIDVIGHDLYDGLAGVCLYFSYLAFHTSHKNLQSLAEGSLRTLEAKLPELSVTSASIGAFDGLGGYIYLYAHLSALWGDKSIIEKVTPLLTSIANRIENDKHFDLIGGSAGCILSLLALHSQLPNTRALEIAISCGDQLIARLRPVKSKESEKCDRLLFERGFSHGYSGLAWALCSLGNVAKEERFREASREFIAIERRLLNGGRWTDPDDPQLKEQATWCHGAPGIALSRLAIWRNTRANGLLAEAEFALEQMTCSATLDNHCLCHGELGNLETLLVASQVFPSNSKWQLHFEKRKRKILEEIATYGWRSDRPGFVEVPGLMTGLAGIGFELMRLAHPADIPSILLLESPIGQ